MSLVFPRWFHKFRKTALCLLLIPLCAEVAQSVPAPPCFSFPHYGPQSYVYLTYLRTFQAKKLFPSFSPFSVPPPDHLIALSLEIVLDPRVITYWRYPGSAGLAPNFSFEESKNLSRVDIFYPAPEQFWKGGLESLGYENRVVLPMLLHVIDNKQPIQLVVTMDYGLCDRLCLSEQARLSLVVLPDRLCEKELNPLPIAEQAAHYHLPAYEPETNFYMREFISDTETYLQIIPRFHRLSETIRYSQLITETESPDEWRVAMVGIRGNWVLNLPEPLAQSIFLLERSRNIGSSPSPFLRITFIHQDAAVETCFFFKNDNDFVNCYQYTQSVLLR